MYTRLRWLQQNLSTIACVTAVEVILLIVSLRNRMAEGRRWQNFCVLQMWRGYYLRYKFVGNFLNTDVLCSSTKRSVLRNAKFGGRLFQTKSLSHLSHKVCCCLSSLIVLHKFTNIANYTSSCPMELNINKEITWKQQNHGFLSKKYTSQALYQTLHTTKMNFEKLSGAKKFSEKTTISIHFNLLQVCPSWPIFVFAGLFNSSVSFLMFVENIFMFQSIIGGSSNC